MKPDTPDAGSLETPSPRQAAPQRQDDDSTAEATPFLAIEHGQDAAAAFERSFEEPYVERDAWRSPVPRSDDAHELPIGPHPDHFGALTHAEGHASVDFGARRGVAASDVVPAQRTDDASHADSDDASSKERTALDMTESHGPAKSP